jgi:hypothetical protein
MSVPLEITVFAKTGGPLTKRISLAADGSIKSDGSACVMAKGSARRFSFTEMQQYSELLIALKPNEAIVGGALRPDLPDEVKVITKRKLNGAAHPGVIARTTDFINYRPGRAALAPIDFDLKGMPTAVAAAMDALGGLWPALVSVCAPLAGVERLERASTSTGLFHASTGEPFNGNGGRHVYVRVVDGTDIERFLKALHERCWLKGLGWMMIGTAGQLLERSIVDRVCGTPERLMFEGPPVLIDPVAQNKAARHPIVIEGDALDTVATCPPLTVIELAKLRELRAKEEHRLASDAATARELFIDRQSRQLAQRTGMDLHRARKTIERRCAGVLLPDVELQFDDPELAGKSVADVLVDPARFEGETLADPLEGLEYGVCKARIMRRADGSVWINSFAHGRTTYELKLDFVTVKTALQKAAKDEVADLLVRLVLAADLDDDEIEELRNIASGTTGINKRTLDRKIKNARREVDLRRAQLERDRRAAERRDPRPQIPAPRSDAPWLPEMAALSDALGKASDPEPPMRDIDGVVVQIRVRRVPNLHAFSATGANEEETEEIRLPPAEQPLLTRLSEPQLAELIERHIDYVDDTGRSVHLANTFVHHFHTRPDDNALPLAVSIATLPLVLGDGTLLNGRGLDRDRGIVFRIPAELSVILPDKVDCTPHSAAEAMRFLTDEWLCDVATSYTGKCTLIAAALSVIERSLLPDRPVFWVTAGRRGGGKTTTLIMLLVAVTGIRPAAAAWSPNEEERRKALLAYLLEALPALIWDNIPHGAKISCPHIERSCTTALYSDRKLGVSETIATSAATIHFFTGNNVGPQRDFASRSLQIRLQVDRADPENRQFNHPNPIGWTEAHRGRILAALYTVLLGNPLFRGKGKPAQTRFKTWWSLIGQAVEYASRAHKAYADRGEIKPRVGCPPEAVSFKKLFLAQEDEDDASSDLADALVILANKWPSDEPFRAADVAKEINMTGDWATEDARERASVLREFFFPKLPATQAVTPNATSKQLRCHRDEPVSHNGETFILKSKKDTHEKLLNFYVHRFKSETPSDG